MKISKIHLYVEQLLLKTKQVTVILFYNQDYKKKIYNESSRKGREMIRLEPVPDAGTQKMRKLSWLRDPH